MGILLTLILGALGNALYEASKSGTMTILDLPNEKELLARIESYIVEIYNNQSTLQKEMRDVSFKQDNIVRLLTNLIKQYDIKAQIRTDNGSIRLEVNPDTTEKQIMIAESVSEQLSELAAIKAPQKTNALIKSQPSSLEKARRDQSDIVAITNIAHDYLLSPIFYDWIRRKNINRALFYQIIGKGKYSISRYQAEHFTSNNLSFFVAERNVADFNGDDYIVHKANILESLSDKNNIVFKTNAEKGYFIVKSGSIL